ncbi:DUF4194 domain-containing protein [Candidatus Binatia bacterium]|nr:DUF4194 domain-containing protein [Candidatus Binatia bacterium]
MKGVVYRDADPPLWQALLQLQSQVRDHVAVLGLELMLDEAEGYAYLRQRIAGEGEPEIPRLIPRRQLAYSASLLLVALRKRLAEFDAKSGDTRLVLTEAELVDLVRVLLPATSNEAQLRDRMLTQVNKLVDLGFLRRLRGRDDQYEVQRILKAFVDAQWLGDFEERLRAYVEHGSAAEKENDG